MGTSVQPENNDILSFNIDLWTRHYDYGLWARDLWQALFYKLNIAQWNSLDNFLIDLGYFEKYLKIGKEFYWEHLGDSGFTKIFAPSTFEPYLRSGDDVYLIEFVENNKEGKRFIRVTKQKFED